MSIAEKIFEGQMTQLSFECSLYEADCSIADLSYDYYDGSIEIKGMAPEFRLSEAAQRIIHEAGFAIAFVNHTDFWETHYTFEKGEFKLKNGWRVSYPHKRNDGNPSILVETEIIGWPREWFETGYVKIKQGKLAESS